MWTDHFWMGGMWIFPTIMLIVMLFFIFTIFSRRGGRFPWDDNQGYRTKNDRDEIALDILKKRYAKGEITKEEFDKIKADL